MTDYNVHAWHPALAYQIMQVVLPLSWGQGGEHVNVAWRRTEYINVGVVRNCPNHNKNCIKSSSINDVCASTDSLHLLSLKWKWFIIFPPKWFTCRNECIQYSISIQMSMPFSKYFDKFKIAEVMKLNISKGKTKDRSHVTTNCVCWLVETL